MVTILPKENDWGDFGRDLGSGLVKGYTNRSDEKALQKSIEGLGPNASAREILDAVTKTKTYSPESKQTLLKNYLGVQQFEELKRQHQAQEESRKTEAIKKDLLASEKKKLELGDALALVNSSDLPDEQKAQLAADINNGATSFKAVKEIVKPKKGAGVSEFEKGLAKENVKQYVEAEKSIVQSQRNLNDLKRISELNEKLKGVVGMFQAYNHFNEDAAELSALGFGVIEPIVKVFNPSGPIAQKKLEQLQKIYAVNPTDSYAKIKGKTAALERYATYAKDIAQQRIELFKKYNGTPPLGEISRLDQLANQLGDQMLQENPLEPKVYYSTKDGRPVKAKSLEQQEELLNKGLITDVKPTR